MIIQNKKFWTQEEEIQLEELTKTAKYSYTEIGKILKIGKIRDNW